MNDAKKNLLIAGACILLLLGVIAAFTYTVDPLCYYCKEITIEKKTVNRYYLMAQLILKNPETQQIILGSSRGETTSPLWVQQQSGLKTLNLSASGAEFITKKAFLGLAMEKLSLKRVIWYADYFELISSNADTKIKNTRALNKYAKGLIANDGWAGTLRELQQLIDHKTIEASFAALKQTPDSGLKQGEGERVDYSLCASSDFKGKETPESLRNEVELIYESYVHGAIRPPQNPEMAKAFVDLMKELQAKNIPVVIVIPPYNPTFMERLKTEHSDIYEAHLKWIHDLESLQGPGLDVKNYFPGIPNDDGSPRYWNDGVHFTCKGVIDMLQKAL